MEFRRAQGGTMALGNTGVKKAMKPTGDPRFGYHFAHRQTAGGTMFDSEDDAFDKEFGRLVVERRVYDAGSEILKSAALGKAAFIVAEQRQDECRDKGDDAGAAFWQKVWNFLMDKCNA